MTEPEQRSVPKASWVRDASAFVVTVTISAILLMFFGALFGSKLANCTVPVIHAIQGRDVP